MTCELCNKFWFSRRLAKGKLQTVERFWKFWGKTAWHQFPLSSSRFRNTVWALTTRVYFVQEIFKKAITVCFCFCRAGFLKPPLPKGRGTAQAVRVFNKISENVRYVRNVRTNQSLPCLKGGGPRKRWRDIKPILKLQNIVQKSPQNTTCRVCRKYSKNRY